MPFDFDKDISDGAKAWMKFLGNFTPTVLPERRELKGYALDENGESGKAYYDSGELRELGSWLYEQQGFPTEYVQALLGHATPEMTAYYQDGHEQKEVIYQHVQAGLKL